MSGASTATATSSRMTPAPIAPSGRRRTNSPMTARQPADGSAAATSARTSIGGLIAIRRAQR
jgi:hypothetical protein